MEIYEVTINKDGEHPLYVGPMHGGLIMITDIKRGKSAYIPQADAAKVASALIGIALGREVAAKALAAIEGDDDKEADK